MPLEATQHTGRGAQAFAGFFIKTIDWGYATINGAYIRHAALSTCTACAGIAKTIDKDREAKHRYIGGRLSVRSSKINKVSNGTTSVTVTSDGTSREVVDAEGHFVAGYPAYPNLRFAITLVWSSSEWHVSRFAVIA